MRRSRRDEAAPSPLTPAALYILLALAPSERHGYAIMREVEEMSGGKVRVGPGTLYRTLKRLLEDGLIEEADERPDPQLDDERRRYYRLTEDGRRAMTGELQRMDQLVKQAREARLLPELGLALTLQGA